MNESAKLFMNKVKVSVVEKLEANFTPVPLYEDEVPEDKTTEYDNGAPYHLMIMRWGPIGKRESEKTLSQDFSIDYYSENRADVDEMTLDIITLLNTVKTVNFTASTKFRARHANTKRFVDVVTIDFTRMIKIEC